MADRTTEQDDAQRRAALEERVRGGAWLLPGEVACLLGVSRYTVAYWLDNDKMRYRRHGGGTWRECSPADVLDRLESSRRTHGDAPSP